MEVDVGKAFNCRKYPQIICLFYSNCYANKVD